jgi:hypothetical protein
LSNVAGGANDSRCDGIADSRSDAKPHAKYLEEDASKVVDNEVHRDFQGRAIILARRENARLKTQSQNTRHDFAGTDFAYEVEWWRQSARPLSSRK